MMAARSSGLSWVSQAPSSRQPTAATPRPSISPASGLTEAAVSCLVMTASLRSMVLDHFNYAPLPCARLQGQGGLYLLSSEDTTVRRI